MLKAQGRRPDNLRVGDAAPGVPHPARYAVGGYPVTYLPKMVQVLRVPCRDAGGGVPYDGSGVSGIRPTFARVMTCQGRDAGGGVPYDGTGVVCGKYYLVCSFLLCYHVSGAPGAASLTMILEDDDMSLPSRKAIRIPDFDYSTPCAYFVTICTQDRRCILSDITVGDAALGVPELRLTDIGKIVEKYVLSTDRIPNLRVDKYCVMPNHVHMIVVVAANNGTPRAASPTREAIPNAVRVLKRLTNKEAGQELWQRSYHDHVIRNENDYREIWTYIDNNPAKWAIDRYYEA